MTYTLILITVAALAVFAMIAALISRYKRCPSDKLLVVYGKTSGGTAKIYHGGGTFIWPVIQDYEWLDLKPMAIDIDLRGALTSQNIRIDVPSTFTVAISSESGVMKNAAECLLGLKRNDIAGLARGDYERLSKQAEGFSEIVKAAGGDPDKAVQLMITDKLDELMRIQVEAIKNIKIDSITVWDQGSGGSGQGTTAGFLKDVLTFVPGFEEVYKMAGKELPAILQGAGTKAKAELEAAQSVNEEESDDFIETE